MRQKSIGIGSRAVVRLLAAIAFAGLAIVPGQAAVVISDDMGGPLGDYLMKYSQIRKSGQMVVIDGRCYSSCTIVTGSIPQKNICVTARAELGFHAATMGSGWGPGGPSNTATRAMFSLYPANIKSWINRNGGLSTQTKVLRGRELASMYPPCPQSAAARPSPRPAVSAVSADITGSVRTKPAVSRAAVNRTRTTPDYLGLASRQPW